MSSIVNHIPTRAPAEEATAEVAGKKLEAFFLRRMLAEMRATVGEGMFSGGYAEETFQDMLDEAMADEMSKSGGVGIAEMISKELEGFEKGGSVKSAQFAGDEYLAISASGGKSAVAVATNAVAPSIASPPSMSLAASPPSLESSIGVARASRAYKAHNHKLSTMPVEARVSSNFGRRIHPVTGAKSFHEGIDLAAVKGTKVGVSGPGVVVRAGKGGTYGNIVIVDHGGGLETRYAHLNTINVKVGQQLATGESVGTVGATGRVTGAHLHFEVRRGGKAIDPGKLLGQEKK
ncbi:MAG: peptidoglycan DD-metalloendopeptidase family protein [Kofleriaceae bacterium]|nr:peptidoglycan DD-metalloendopeptidase family protein [Kofleriaceae bacterium]